MKKKGGTCVNLCVLLALVAVFGMACKSPKQLWQESKHADSTAEAFVHWDNDTPDNVTGLVYVPVTCARCHTTPGFIDFIGGDGSAAGSVENPVPVDEAHKGITCDACHNDAAKGLNSITFPSGKTVTGLGTIAICGACHQGRESGKSIETVIAAAGLDKDTAADNASSKLKFKNVHYKAAAATIFGNESGVGFEYPGKTYSGKSVHVATRTPDCKSCHNQHSSAIDIKKCSKCHTYTSVEDVEEFDSAENDYDGDGVAEPIKKEIGDLQAELLAAMQDYAQNVNGGKCIVYDGATYPYFLLDTNCNGVADESEKVDTNGYKPWTPRLLKAAYNYQVSLKDTGAFAHNAKYISQLLKDSIADVKSVLP